MNKKQRNGSKTINFLIVFPISEKPSTLHNFSKLGFPISNPETTVVKKCLITLPKVLNEIKMHLVLSNFAEQCEPKTHWKLNLQSFNYDYQECKCNF